MRLGQTSAIHFGSQLLASLAGFVATLYIAQELGGAALGTYSLFVAVLIWLKTLVGSGVHEAIKKRLSETGEAGRELGASIVLLSVGFLVVAVVTVVLSDLVNAFFRIDAALLLVVTLALVLVFSLVRAVLEGEKKVHVSSVLWPLDRVVRSGVQLGVVFLGLFGGGVVGLVYGYVAGAAVAATLGFFAVATSPRLPRRADFERVISFVRYAWLSGVEERSISSMDTVVLGLFVSSSLIGYYEVAWNLASILAVFGTSISDSLFPAISNLESEGKRAAVADLVNKGLAYTGLFLFPGLLGSVLLGERVLAIYGQEFRQAQLVLVILVLARLVYAYEAQFVSALNAIDRPDVAFRVNAVFVAFILGLNLVFVWQFGWVGAAVATTLASAVGLMVGYRALSGLVGFEVPYHEIGKQALAAVVMAGVVYLAEIVLVQTAVGGIVVTLTLVGLGAVVYFIVLVSLSTEFRKTLRDNLATSGRQ